MELLENNKILIVDDEKDIADSLKIILEGQSKIKKSLSEKAKGLFGVSPSWQVVKVTFLPDFLNRSHGLFIIPRYSHSANNFARARG